MGGEVKINFHSPRESLGDHEIFPLHHEITRTRIRGGGPEQKFNPPRESLDDHANVSP